MEQLENCTAIIQDMAGRIVPKLDKGTIVNVNFPDLPPAELKGVKLCEMGPREYDEKFEVETNPGGRKYYWYTDDPYYHYEGYGVSDLGDMRKGLVGNITDYEPTYTIGTLRQWMVFINME